MKTNFKSFLGRRDQKIVYNLLKTDAGWQVQAFLPRQVSANDRIAVIDWFHGYRSQVQREHPFWLTSFSGTDQAYFLDIVRADSPKDMIAKAINRQSQIQPEQLSFDYV